MKKLFLIAAVVMAMGTTQVLAQFNSTAEQRTACRSDALRLCSAYISNLPQMQDCMFRNKEKLSNACRRVVEGKEG